MDTCFNVIHSDLREARYRPTTPLIHLCGLVVRYGDVHMQSHRSQHSNQPADSELLIPPIQSIVQNWLFNAH